MHASEYEHIKRGKERVLPSTSPLYCLFLYLLLPAISGIPRQTTNNPLHCLFFADDGLFGFFIACLTGCPPLSRPIPVLRSSHVPAGVYAIRPFCRLRCLDGRSKKLYALYASKNRLCTLCENTTPKKTAYNAYRNANRRVRRAEGL